jgi:hypothetical protein
MNARKVCVATVDNFQAEQSDIILISLVRSNIQGDIGFLSSKERVNVMLSRARHGQIILGNMQTFSNCRKPEGKALWQKIKELLDKSKQLLPYFPAKCSVHHSVQNVDGPDDFPPFGGCHLDCPHILECGHTCPLKCHPNLNARVEMRCKVMCLDKCTYGHTVKRPCSDSAPKCERSITWMCSLKHICTGPCYKGKLNTPCHRCDQQMHAEKEQQLMESKLKETLEARYVRLDQCKFQFEKVQLKNAH